MVDRDEHRSLALTGEYGGQISAPHRVHGLRNDGAIMRSRSAWRTSAAGCQQPILAHQSQHPPPRGAYAAVSQPGPDLAMASPWNGLSASTARIASSNRASAIGPAGPRRSGCAGDGG